MMIFGFSAWVVSMYHNNSSNADKNLFIVALLPFARQVSK